MMVVLKMARENRRCERNKTLEARKNLKQDILQTISILTPPRCTECSTQEIHANISEDGYTIAMHGVAFLLGRYRIEGVVKSRLEVQRHLWRLTAKGRQWLKTNYVPPVPPPCLPAGRKSSGRGGTTRRTG
jgi:hypothetical protein